MTAGRRDSIRSNCSPETKKHLANAGRHCRMCGDNVPCSARRRSGPRSTSTRGFTMRRRFTCSRVGFLLIVLASVLAFPAYARTIKDVGSSSNGQNGNCPPQDLGGPCLYFQLNGSVPLAGTDANGNPITVTITFSDWGCQQDLTFHTCTPQAFVSNGIGDITNVVLDVVLQGTNTPTYTLNLQRFTMSGIQTGLQSAPTYVSCEVSGAAIPCVWNPMPDTQNLQEPSPIAASDGINTQWDFGSTPTVDQFVDIQICTSSNYSDCPTTPQGLGEAILVIGGSFASDNLSLDPKNYLAVVADSNGNVFNLGGLTPPVVASAAGNNTQATATAITTSSFTDFVDTSQLSPSENSDGSMQFPQGFVLPPVPSCNPPNGANTDTRIFRTAWYSYTAPSDGSVTIDTAKSHYDTLVYVLTGNNNSEIACNDDPASGNLLQAKATFSVTGGNTYNIIVMHTPTEQTLDSSNNLVGYPLSTDGTLYVKFQFTATLPSASVSASSLQFSGQIVNTSSSSQPITLTNNGPSALSITNIAASSGFSQTNNCPISPTTLAANGSCTINVVFSPASTGSETGTLTITDNASNGNQVVMLSGSGTDFQVSASALSSSSIQPGQKSTSTVSISPTGAFTSTVALTCSIAPATQIPPVCGFSPTSIADGSGTSTLTISTIASSAFLRAPYGTHRMFWVASFVPLLFGGALLRMRRRRLPRTLRFFGQAIVLMLICLLLISVGCGGSSSSPTPAPKSAGTTAGNYTVTITGSVGQLTRNTTLTFTVP